MWVGASAPTHCENKETNHASGLKPGPTCLAVFAACLTIPIILTTSRDETLVYSTWLLRMSSVTYRPAQIKNRAPKTLATGTQSSE